MGIEKQKKKLEDAVIFIDCSALKGMFNGEKENKSEELLKKMKDLNDKGNKLKVITTLSSFQRAIFLANPEIKIQNIQKALSFLEVAPSFADFRNEEAVRDEVIRFVKIMTRRGSENKMGKDKIMEGKDGTNNK